jgi:hypothetical protein
MPGWRACSSKTCDRVLAVGALPPPTTYRGCDPPGRRLGVEGEGRTVEFCSRWTSRHFGYRFGPWTTKQKKGVRREFQNHPAGCNDDVARRRRDGPTRRDASHLDGHADSVRYLYRPGDACLSGNHCGSLDPKQSGWPDGKRCDSGQLRRCKSKYRHHHFQSRHRQSGDGGRQHRWIPGLFTFNGGGTPLGTPLTDTPPSNPPPTFNYSNTSTTFTVGLESGGSVTYHAFYASVNASTKIPQFVIFGGIEKPGCTTTGIAIHQ